MSGGEYFGDLCARRPTAQESTTMHAQRDTAVGKEFDESVAMLQSVRGMYRDLYTDYQALHQWQINVTAALGRSGGAHFEDVPKHITDMRDELARTVAALTAERMNAPYWKQQYECSEARRIEANNEVWAREKRCDTLSALLAKIIDLVADYRDDKTTMTVAETMSEVAGLLGIENRRYGSRGSDSLHSDTPSGLGKP